MNNALHKGFNEVKNINKPAGVLGPGLLAWGFLNNFILILGKIKIISI